jgi:hypothetical protein
MTGNGIPLRPDIGATLRRERTALNRSLAACVLGKLHNQRPGQFIAHSWPGDSRAAAITRAAVPPFDTTSGSALSIAKVSPLLLVAPGAAASKLFDVALRFDLSGVSTISVPHAASHPVPLFVAEGAPLPVTQAATGTTTLGPTRKLTFALALTRELDEATPDSAATVLGRLLGEAAAKSLDVAVFGTSASSASQPAGLLYGVTALSASTASVVIDAISEDLGTLAQAFSDAAINPDGMVVITSPRSALALRMALGYQVVPLPVLMSPSVAAGTVIAVIPEAVASAYSGIPEIDVVREPSIHFEDTAPLAIGTPGSPPTVAAPTRSLWQQELIGVKLRMRCAWASLQPGAVAFMTGTKW